MNVIQRDICILDQCHLYTSILYDFMNLYWHSMAFYNHLYLLCTKRRRNIWFMKWHSIALYTAYTYYKRSVMPSVKWWLLPLQFMTKILNMVGCVLLISTPKCVVVRCCATQGTDREPRTLDWTGTSLRLVINSVLKGKRIPRIDKWCFKCRNIFRVKWSNEMNWNALKL